MQRIRKAGGVVMPSMGTMRVNGVLGVSRAIGKLILIYNFERYDFIINLIIINNYIYYY